MSQRSDRLSAEADQRVFRVSLVPAVCVMLVAVLSLAALVTGIAVDGPGIYLREPMAWGATLMIPGLAAGAVHLFRSRPQIVLTLTGFSHFSHPDVRWADVGPFELQRMPGGSRRGAQQLVTTLTMTGPDGPYPPEQLALVLPPVAGHSSKAVVRAFNEYRDRATATNDL